MHNTDEEVDKSQWSSTHTRVERTEIHYTSLHKQSTNPVEETSSSSSTTSSSLEKQISALPKPSAALQVRPIIEKGFKHYGHRMRLYCRTGFCLMIFPDGKVLGDELGEHPAGILEFSSAGIGEVRIRAVNTNLYLAMNQSGILYGEEDPRNYATVFVEGSYGQYNTYLSQKYAHLGWYVGIKKNGNIKKASQTKWGQKAIQFLPVRTN